MDSAVGKQTLVKEITMLEGIFGKKKPKKPQEEASKKPTKTKKSEKEIATENNEPYVAIVSMDIDPDNPHEGAFELDWNDKFIINLIKAGYQMEKDETDDVIVDRWFQNVCRHVVMETYEQDQAMNLDEARFTRSRDLGNGRREVS